MQKRAHRVAGEVSGRSPGFWTVVAGIALLAAGALTLALPRVLSPPRTGVVGSLPTNSVVAGPDRDVSCTTDMPPADEPCATLLPTLAPEERTLGRPLVAGPLDVALDHIGGYRVRVGEATLVRGLVQDMRLRIGNTADGTYAAPFFTLELEDAATGRKLPRNVYDKGMVDGLQRVNVYLVFELLSHAPGAIVRVERVLVF
jgi:hypothetical protein